MISKLFYSNLRLFGRMSVSSSLHYPLSHFSFIFSLLSFLFSLLFLSCNKPFQPEVAYTPELNVYSVLFSDAHGVYVRVGAVTESSSGVSQAMHGASVTLVGNGPNNSPVEPVTLTDTTALLDGISTSFYYAPTHIIPGGSYSVSVTQNGYPPVLATAQIPSGYATIPDQNTYSILQNPKNVKTDINLSSECFRVSKRRICSNARRMSRAGQHW